MRQGAVAYRLLSMIVYPFAIVRLVYSFFLFVRPGTSQACNRLTGSIRPARTHQPTRVEPGQLLVRRGLADSVPYKNDDCCQTNESHLLLPNGLAPTNPFRIQTTGISRAAVSVISQQILRQTEPVFDPPTTTGAG